MFCCRFQNDAADMELGDEGLAHRDVAVGDVHAPGQGFREGDEGGVPVRAMEYFLAVTVRDRKNERIPSLIQRDMRFDDANVVFAGR